MTLDAPSWRDVAVAIPTVRARVWSLHNVIAQLADRCGTELLGGPQTVITEHVPGDPARVTFPRALAAAAACGRRWVLQLEDDVHLAPTFGTDALRCLVDGAGADVITLFSRSKLDLDAMSRGKLFRQSAPSSFSMSQAFFIRRDLAAGLADFAPGWYERHPEHNRAADLLLGAYLSAQKARVLVWVPSLVQHRLGKSTLPGHRGARQSESYRRVFGEVP